MHTVNLVLSVIGLGAAVGSVAWTALSHEPRIQRLETRAEEWVVKHTTPQERADVEAYIRAAKPALATAAKGEAAALEREALAAGVRYAAGRGLSLTGDQIIGAALAGIAEGPLAAAVQATAAALAGVPAAPSGPSK